MGISKPIVLEIAHRTYAINEFGMATCFVLYGEERGLVIDAGCGMYNIKEIADELCPVPYDVLISHGHGDHIAWMDMWDEVWLHPGDWPMVQENLKAAQDLILRYPSMMAAHGTFDAYDITADQVRCPQQVPKLLPLEDGQIFDLGGRQVEVIHTPGHTLGECVFLDPTERILFSGDGCNVWLLVLATDIPTALEGILKIKSRQDSFDRNFNGHIGYGGSTVNICMPNSVVDDCIHIMRSILDGTAEIKQNPRQLEKSAAFSSCVEYGNTCVVFDANRIVDKV